MRVAVRYHSRTGNTKKVAHAIANAAGVIALDLSVPLAEKVDVLFLGSAMYAGGVDESVKKFIARNREKIGTLYAFSTAAVAASTYKQVKKLAAESGVQLSEKEFHCRGAFSLLHRSRPDEDNLRAAAAFARDVLK